MVKINTIISNYNYGWNIVKCINSAINLLCDKFEHSVIVVDDGSTDDSISNILNNFELVSQSETGLGTVYSFKNFTLIHTENQGASKARNLAIEWDSASFYHILDADDLALPNKLITMFKKMEDAEIGVVYADYVINRPLYNKIEFKKSYSISRLMNECIVHSGSLIRSKYLEEIKLPNGEYYDSNLHGPASKGFIGCTEDYDLWIRLSKVCLMTHVAEPLTIVNEHGNNQSMKMTQEIFNNNLRIMSSR